MVRLVCDAVEELLRDGIALAGVAQYPARVKWALLAWIAWKDAAIQEGAYSSNGDEVSVDSTKEQN